VEDRIGRYILQGKIGSGSTGTVYLALEPDLERRVAIKQLAPELAGDPQQSRTGMPANRSIVMRSC
jgi:serine/threonine protein kinase